MWIANHDFVFSVYDAVAVLIHKNDITRLSFRQCRIGCRLFICLENARCFVPVEISDGLTNFGVSNQITYAKH